MKLLADECLYLLTTIFLRKHGHDVLTIQETGLNGIIVLKIRPDNISLVHENLINFLKKYAKEKIEQTLVIIDHNKFRIRR